MMDDDYTVSDEVKKLAKPFSDGLSMLCGEFVMAAIAAGLTEAQAISTVTYMLIDCAAGAACRNRVHLLGGDPDPARWKLVTERAFERAVERTSPSETEASDG